MKSHLTKNLFVLMLTAMVTVPMFSVSQAASLNYNKKSVPGNQCLIREAYASYHYYDHYIENTSPFSVDPNTKLPANVYVTCPIVRDQMSSDYGLYSVDVYVTGSVDKTLYCQLEVLKAQDNLLGYNSLYLAFDMTPTTDSQGTRFSWIPKQDFPEGSTYQVYCNLPKGARLLSYTWNERDH